MEAFVCPGYRAVSLLGLGRWCRRSGGRRLSCVTRAVQMVLDRAGECGSEWAAIRSVAEKLGPKPETVRL
jgi:hypothetical protein